MQTPLPELTLAGLFGEIDDTVSFDNIRVAVPPDTRLEQAAAAVDRGVIQTAFFKAVGGR
ncbi:MAG: hypothetical protein R3C05_09920 [Pirellulaceae bacterium]